MLDYFINLLRFSYLNNQEVYFKQLCIILYIMSHNADFRFFLIKILDNLSDFVII